MANCFNLKGMTCLSWFQKSRSLATLFSCQHSPSDFMCSRMLWLELALKHTFSMYSGADRVKVSRYHIMLYRFLCVAKAQCYVDNN